MLTVTLTMGPLDRMVAGLFGVTDPVSLLGLPIRVSRAALAVAICLTAGFIRRRSRPETFTNHKRKPHRESIDF